MRFTLELYNLSSTWHDDGRTAYQIDEFKRAVTDASRELTSFTASKRGLDNPETDAAGGGAASGADGGAADGSDGTADSADRAADKAARSATGRLEDSGYEVVPDVFEVNGDVWDLIDKVHMELFFSPSLMSH